MKTVFFGSPEAALPSLEALLAAGHSVEIVVTQPDRPAGRGRRPAPSAVKAFAVERGLPVIAPTKIRADETARRTILDAGADVHVVVAYGQIIPNDVHAPPRYHSLNVHFSLLPKYRGAAPVQWAVLNGDPETGVTVIELNDRMDEGDVLASESVAIGPGETAGELERRLARLGAGLLVRTLDGIDRLPRVPQDHGQATLAPKVRKEDGLIDWNATAFSVDRRVRALGERPGAFTFFNGKRINILRGGPGLARIGDGGPGRIASVDKNGLLVACGSGQAYLIAVLQPEGRGAMSAHAFSLGTKLSPGDLLG